MKDEKERLCVKNIIYTLKIPRSHNIIDMIWKCKCKTSRSWHQLQPVSENGGSETHEGINMQLTMAQEPNGGKKNQVMGQCR